MTIQPYPFQLKLEVFFRDLDAMGHVNNAVYFVYMETIRIKFMQALGALKDGSIILAEASCAYRSPAFLGEQLVISLGVSRFGTKSFDMRYRIETEEGRLVATGKTVQVMYDYQADKTIPVPDDFKARVLAFQGDWRFGDLELS